MAQPRLGSKQGDGFHRLGRSSLSSSQSSAPRRCSSTAAQYHHTTLVTNGKVALSAQLLRALLQALNLPPVAQRRQLAAGSCRSTATQSTGLSSAPESCHWCQAGRRTTLRCDNNESTACWPPPRHQPGSSPGPDGPARHGAIAGQKEDAPKAQSCRAPKTTGCGWGCLRVKSSSSTHPVQMRRKRRPTNSWPRFCHQNIAPEKAGCHQQGIADVDREDRYCPGPRASPPAARQSTTRHQG